MKSTLTGDYVAYFFFCFLNFIKRYMTVESKNYHTVFITDIDVIYDNNSSKESGYNYASAKLVEVSYY